MLILISKLGLDIMKTYLHAKTKFLGQSIHRLECEEKDREKHLKTLPSLFTEVAGKASRDDGLTWSPIVNMANFPLLHCFMACVLNLEKRMQ